MSKAITTFPAASIPSLDGVRALAVLLVFFAHSGLEHVVPGGLGVTTFFVLSGYLITTLMRREYQARDLIALRSFYLRRALRLMPPLLIIVAIAGGLSSAKLIDGGFSTSGLLAVLFYFGNYHIIANDFHGLPAGLGVVWSLAVEEHYYLLFPPLAILLLRLQRPRFSALVLVTLCAAILAWRFWLYTHDASDAYLSMATDTRADSILVGALMALWHNPVIDPVISVSPRRERTLIALCVGTLLATLLWRDEAFRLTARYTLQSLAIAPLIYLAVTRSKRIPFRWLSSAPMVYLGSVSYTIYLAHQMILYGVMRNAPQLGWTATLALTALLTLAVAEPMRRWVDVPCGRLRQRLHRRSAPAADVSSPLPAVPSP
jgi:peptidoglycan/LPS O-acetylase OafA/YrhL